MWAGNKLSEHLLSPPQGREAKNEASNSRHRAALQGFPSGRTIKRPPSRPLARKHGQRPRLQAPGREGAVAPGRPALPRAGSKPLDAAPRPLAPGPPRGCQAAARARAASPGRRARPPKAPPAPDRPNSRAEGPRRGTRPQSRTLTLPPARAGGLLGATAGRAASGHGAGPGKIGRLTCSSRSSRYHSLRGQHGASAFSRSSRGAARAGNGPGPEEGNGRGLGSRRNWGKGGARGTAKQPAQGGSPRRDRRPKASAGRAGAGKRTLPNPATAQHECACAGARSAPPATWSCAMGATVRWEL